uniref:hypothetical protein n=1 Tax=Coccidioides posadasii TaxID=199306 RepID=UPI001D001EE3|nr:hypothetical protein LI437_mgp26 [Coccidioides posadasii]QVG61966.1 hypothetical protein [Coccidioides posadasii]
MSWCPKASTETDKRTTGWPTESNLYWSQSRSSTWFGPTQPKYDWGNTQWKGRSTVRIASSFRYYSTGSTRTVVDKIEDLSLWCTKFPSRQVDRKLYKLMCDPDLLYLAYNNIKSKTGNMTPGIVPTTLDGMSFEEFGKLSESLKNESFEFKPKGGSRPLTIAPPRDKIVQEAMRIILNAIYEPTFLESSHGFRPNKSCHSALKQVYQKFKAISWVIEGDISKCFDSIDHHRLVNLIEAKILDKQFIKLIWKSLRAGYFEFKVYNNNIIGTPQGSIISPLLANIFLHQLDVFVEDLRIKFDKGSRPRVSPEYTRIRHMRNVASKSGDVRKAKKLHKSLLNTEYILYSDPNFKRLNYVRYADDWIIGIRGSKIEATVIKQLIAEFLNSIGLTLSEEKTKISNFSTDEIKFLGVIMTRSDHINYYKTKTNTTQRGSLKMRLLAPMVDIRNKLKLNKFIDSDRANPKFIWMGYSHKQIINLYNSVLRGFLNYYSFVHNYSRLATYLYWVLKGSCAKLLAAKFTLGSVKKVLAKFGEDLEYTENVESNNKRSPKEKKATKFYKPPNYRAKYWDF